MNHVRAQNYLRKDTGAETTSVEQISFVFPFFTGPYGAERLISDIVKAVQSKHRALLYTLFATSRSQELFSQNTVCRVLCPLIEKTSHSFRTLISPFLLWLFVPPALDRQTTVVHLMNWQSALLAPRINRRCPDAQIIYHCTEPPRFIHDLRAETLSGKNFLTRALLRSYMKLICSWEQAAFKKIDRIISISEWTASQVQKLYHRDSLILYPGIQLERFQHTDKQRAREQLGLADNLTVYLTVSKLHRRKRIDQSIDLFLTEASNNSCYYIIGTGPDEQHLKNKISALADPRIMLLGELADVDVATYLTAADNFLFTAKDEPFGIAPLEAKAAGCKVIGVDINYPVISCAEAGEKILEVYSPRT